jgi:hypothetical protein
MVSLLCNFDGGDEMNMHVQSVTTEQEIAALAGVI